MFWQITKAKLILIISGLLMLGLLAGCGKKVTEEPTESDLEESVIEISREIPEIVTEDSEEFVTIGAEKSEEDVMGEFAPVEVINNNGHFVQVNGKVYFHVPDADSMGRTAIWARYSDNECGRTVLFEYNPDTDEAQAIAYDYTCGGLSLQDDSFYSLIYEQYGLYSDATPAIGSYSVADNEASMNRVSPDTTLLGAGINRNYIATTYYNQDGYESGTEITILKNGNRVFTTPLDMYISCVGLGADEVFYISGEPDTGYFLQQMDVTTGDVTELGRLPVFKETDYSGYVDECIIDPETEMVYFAYSDYEGTGNYFTEGFYVQAKIGEADSLSYKDMPQKFSYDDPVFAPFAIIDGKMTPSDGEPDTCEIKDNGDLGYFDENGEWVLVATDWVTKFYNDEGDYRGVELAEKVGDNIFLIFNDNAHVPADDIGWRYAYCRNYSDVYCISINSGEGKQIVHQVAPWG